MSVDKLDPALSRMRELAALAAGDKPSATQDAGAGTVDFAAVLKDAVKQVNDAQNAAQVKVQQFSTGASPDLSLEDVMVSLQKANLAFQGMIAVRNKLVDAYQNVTNLQV